MAKEAVVTLDGERFSLRLRVLFRRYEVFIRRPVVRHDRPDVLVVYFSPEASSGRRAA